jgi:hypothetical protein
MAQVDEKERKERRKNLLDQDCNDELQYEQGRNDHPGDEVDHPLFARSVNIY